MAIPLAALLVVAAFGFRQQAGRSDDAGESVDLIETVQAYNEAAIAVGFERLAQLDAEGSVSVAEARQRTDAAIEELNRLGRIHGDADTAQRAVDFEAAVNAAREARIGTAAGGDFEATRPDLVAAYETAVWTVVGLDLEASDFPTPEAFNLAGTDSFFMEGVAMREQAWFNYLVETRSTPEVDPLMTTSAFAMANGTITHSALVAPDDVGTEINLLASSSAGRDLAQLETLLNDGLEFGINDRVNTPEVLAALLASRNEWSAQVTERQIELLDLVEEEGAESSDLQSLFTLAAILGFFVLGGLIFVIYRSINLPLTRLLGRAEEVANEDLPGLVETLRSTDVPEELPTPRPIKTDSADEIGDLVGAFNRVQATAYDLATEQALGRRNVAEMFVNLGRRNQQLLQRIIAKLTQLENEEEDPDKLRDLFELDNVVTRMRRNAESLLVLAGSSTPRQWSKPVSIENTVRAALGEVEGYERVDIAALADAELRGTVVADIAHLLAELLENALNFSDPSTNVLVSGHAENGGYLVSIFDQGIGMSPEEIEDNNLRITDPPPLDQAPTRFLGLFVVGRLADRHDIRVRLVEAPGRGVMARVELPGSLLASADADSGEGVPEIEARVAEVGAAAAAESSPLDEVHDLDEEMEKLASGELIEDDTLLTEGDVFADEAADGQSDLSSKLDEASQHDEAPVSNDELPTLPTRGEAVQDANDELPTLPTRGDAAQDAGDELPTLPTRGGVTETPALPDLPSRPAAASTAPTAPAAVVDAAPAVADAAPALTDGLPTRSRGEAFDGEQAAPARRKEDAPAPAPESADPDAKAGQFSSLMSAFSSGVSRGLESVDEDGPGNNQVED